MDFVGIVAAHHAAIAAMLLGAWIAITRAFLVVRPGATLQLLSRSLEHAGRVRRWGVGLLILVGAPLVSVGLGNRAEPLGQVLIGLGIAGSSGFLWMVLRPRFFAKAITSLLTRMGGTDSASWRALGAVGVLFGLAILAWGWRVS